MWNIANNKSLHLYAYQGTDVNNHNKFFIKMYFPCFVYPIQKDESPQSTQVPKNTTFG